MKRRLLWAAGLGLVAAFVVTRPISGSECSNPTAITHSFQDSATPLSSASSKDKCEATVAFLTSVAAYWSLDDQFFGATANYESKVADGSLDPTPTNDPLRAPYTNRLPAAQFVDGSLEYLSVADPWTSGDIDFSVGCWVYLDDLTGDLPIASKDDGTQREWRLYFDDNVTDAWVFEAFDGAGGSIGTVSSSEVPAATTWTFVVGAHNATTNLVKVSVNGGAYTTSATSGVAVDTDDPFELGRMAAATYHDGHLSQCFFIKEELSAADLGDLYNNGVPVPSRNFAARVATAAEGLWDLSELSGNRSDFTANAITLTDNATVLHGAGLAPRAYKAADLVAASDQDFTVADATAISFGNEDFTVFGWVNPDSAAAGAVISKGTADSVAGTEYDIFLDASLNVACRVSDGSTRSSATATTALTAGEWALVALVYDAAGDTLGCSSLGEAVVTTANTTGAQDGAGTLYIGSRYGSATNDLDGQIGQVGTVRAALSNADIAKLYAGGHAFSCDTIPADVATAAACWPLDSTNWSDSVGTLDLTANGSPTLTAGIADIPGGVTLRAADFDSATTEYLSRSDEAQFSPGDVDFTWWAWTTKETLTGAVVFGKASALTGSTAEWLLANDALGYYCRLWNGANITQTAPGYGSGVVAPGVSHLIICKHDASADVVGASLDGSAFSVTTTAGGAPVDGTESVSIGAENDGANPLNGRAGPVGWIKGAALTDAQAALLYNSGEALSCSDVEAVVGVAPTVCWNLDEASGTRSAAIGTADLTDNNTVTSTGGLIRGGTGHAAAFDASDQSLVLAANATTDVADEDFWYSGWVKFDDVAAQYAVLAQETTSDRSILLYHATGASRIELYVYDGASTAVCSAEASGVTPVATAWHHFVAIHSATDNQCELYIDGTSNGATATTGAPGASAADLTFGASAYPSFERNLKGALDEVFKATGIPTAAQITCLINGGLGRSYADLLAGVCD